MNTINKQINNINNKLDKIDADNIRLEQTLNFINDNTFKYIYNVYRADKLIKTIEVKDSNKLDAIEKTLKTKYNTSIKTNYSNLTIDQLNYLIDATN